MNRSLDDKKLIRELKNNPDTGFSLLFDRFRAGLYAHALSMLGQQSAARDAVQDTFLTALTKIDQLRDEKAIESWLHTVLKNHCRMYFRGKEREFSEGDTREVLLERSVEAKVMDRLEQTQYRESILRALAEIPEKLRLPLLLRYFSGFNSYRQIAGILDIPTGTVRSRLSRGKRRLLKRFRRKESLLQTSESFARSNTAEKKYTRAVQAFYRGEREAFANCFYRNLQLRFTSGREAIGRNRWIQEWEADLESGVRFQPDEILSSGDLTIMEGAFKNPPHDPHHCPPAGTFVFFQKEGKVQRVHIHYGAWENE